MASSSSSVVPPTYEVFISFRGTDTRHNFVSHLRSELDRKGIITYFDSENLKQGQTIKEELPKAIEESSIAIVILSPNFGSSTWCLDELVKIMARRITSGLHVIPIFYEIDPSDVRKQQNSFLRAFEDHEKNFKADQVTNWRNALKEVAGLVGEDIREKDQSSYIKQLADKILTKLSEMRIASRSRESMVGIEFRISEIEKLVYSKPEEVLFIGLWGMGGIGKTTTAKAIFADCRNKFDGSHFLVDVRQRSNDLKKLQEEVVSEILGTKIKGEASSLIQNRLQSKKVLLVIDDVDKREQLNNLAKEPAWFGRGSVIIATTRDSHLLLDNYIKEDVTLLSEEDSLHLFCHHAFKNNHPLQDFKKLSLQVLEYAGGLPLALKVLGDHLYGEEITFWKDTLGRLKVSPENDITSKLKISFDGLNDTHKDIFLNIACFFRGSPKYEVKRRLQSLDLFPGEGIKVLVSKSLIYMDGVTMYYGNNEEAIIEMHDILQDMGRHIVKQKANENINKYSRLWLEEDLVNVLAVNRVSSKVEGICTGLNLASDHGHDILSRAGLHQEAAFRMMNVPESALSFLELCGKRFEGNYDVKVPESSGQLYYNKLRWFSLCHYSGQSLPKSFRPMNIVHLSLQWSNIKETPDFNHMPNLEELDLRHSERLIRVHQSLGDHKKIKHVNLERCSQLVEFPKIYQIESLEILNLEYTKLKRFPEICGKLDSLRKLEVRDTAINGLPTSIVGNANTLQKLELVCEWPYNEEFRSLEVVAGSFPGLVSLQITGSGIVRTLDFSHLPDLKILNLSNSHQLVEVHASLGVHKRIKSINLRKCSKLVDFPRIRDMNSLEELDLSFTSSSSFPEIYGNIDSFRKLNLTRTFINALPTSTVGNVTTLQELVVEWQGERYKICIANGKISRVKIYFRYEVFISFSGEDTCDNFVNHLHSELVRKGMRTYLVAESLKQGQTLIEELPKAIEESSIAIVILSPNYGSSTWCLNELVKIMECKFRNGLLVFPIFYTIDPSDVRKQKNAFLQAFSNHELNFKDDIGTVKIWRKVLEDVANLEGEIVRGKNELACIKNIVDEILRQLPMKASQFRKSVMGIESRISEIKNLMYNKSNEVLFIGLFGMGGIGKTTTARAIFEDCKNEFDGSCFLGDVRQSNNKLEKLQEKQQSNNKLEKLQEKLLFDVLKIKFEDICDVVQGISIIQERLRFKKVLIVIDDVDDIEQLNALVKERDWFGRGSVIIITTRDVHLLRDDHINKYDVQTLPNEEALRLFCLHAFKNDHPPKDYKDLSLQVLKCAGGLPLALKVLGDHLNGGAISFWEGTLSDLEVLPEIETFSKLMICFDGLNAIEQNIFLKIACFFRGHPKYEVEKRLQSLGLHPEEGIDVLVRKSFLYIDFQKSFNKFEHVIEMHDLLQEMGWHIVRERAQWDIRRYNQLWLRKDIVNVLSNTTVCSEVEGICMNLHDDDDDDDDDVRPLLGWETAFRQMDKLTFFELDGSLFEKKFERNLMSSHYIFELLFGQSSGQLYNPNLRWFSLSGYPGRSLPQGFRPMNLLHLSLQHSRIIKTPNFSHMPNLEELDLRFSYNLIHVHPSLGDHKKIKFVYLNGCSELVDFPKMKKMESLEVLDLSETKIKEFPEMYGNSLRVLNVGGTSMNGLPTSIVGKANALQELKLDCGRPYRMEFTSLEVLAGSFWGLVSLQITGSGILRTVDFSYFPYLEKLDLSGSDKLAEVHESLGFHKRIKSINLRDCSKLVEFVRIVEMSSLEELDLSFTGLESLPEMYGNLDSFMRLNVIETDIIGLPTSIVGKVTALQELLVEWGPAEAWPSRKGRYKLRMVNSAEVLKLVENE